MAKRKLILLTLVAMMALAAALSAVPAFGTGGNKGKGPTEDLRERARPVFDIEGVIFTDANERTGLLEIGVDNEGRRKAVEQKLEQLGIPLSSVRILVTKPIVEVATLQDRVRPLEGGLQIAWQSKRSWYVCTLGFNAIRESDSKEGFLTNSHCTSKEFVSDGTVYHQPLPNNPVGKEIADPPAFDCGIKGKKCRWSDAALAERTSGVEATLGSIARTDGVSSGSLEIVGSFGIVNELAGNASIGTVVRKVGRSTGQTEGVVDRSCVDTAAMASRVIRLCQDWVKADVQIVAEGDSGSPVFALNDNPETAEVEVTLLGILWGGSSDGTLFVYSPIANVEQDHGALTTHP